MSFRRSRIRAGMTATEAAKRIGVSRVTVYLWETGRNLPTGRRLPKIAELYGCTVDDLLRKED